MLWVVYVFFGHPSEVYFIEALDREQADKTLSANFNRTPETEIGRGDVFATPYLRELLDLFAIDEDHFLIERGDPQFYIRYMIKNDGEFCKQCREYNWMAESNQSDGTFVCWSCRRA